jgi:hypothetical protein
MSEEKAAPTDEQETNPRHSRPWQPPRRQFTAPETTITSGPTDGSTVASRDQTFSFTSTEAGSTFECSVDNGATDKSCSSGETFTFTEGSNTFEVKATDAAGNRDQTPANRAFTVDTTAPGAPSITAPATNSFDRDGSFDIKGTAEPGSTVRLYEGSTQVGTDEADPQSGAWTIALVGVPEGSHTYKAKATDAAGNVSQDSQPTTVVVDKTAPTITAKTPTGTGVARNTNVSATFSESIDRASIEASGTVKLALVGNKGKTTPVAASVTYNSGTKTVTLDPATNLGSKATYTVTIPTAAKDVAGNALARPETWTFTTGAR